LRQPGPLARAAPTPEEASCAPCPRDQKTWPITVHFTDGHAPKEAGRWSGTQYDGVLNTALQLRGDRLFTDMVENPALADHLFGVVAETQRRVAQYMRSRTGTCSIAVNRSILNVDPGIYVHANCSMQMVSPAMFRKRLLDYERRLAGALPPYEYTMRKIRHLFIEDYAGTNASSTMSVGLRRGQGNGSRARPSSTCASAPYGC